MTSGITAVRKHATLRRMKSELVQPISCCGCCVADRLTKWEAERNEKQVEPKPLNETFEARDAERHIRRHYRPAASGGRGRQLTPQKVEHEVLASGCSTTQQKLPNKEQMAQHSQQLVANTLEIPSLISPDVYLGNLMSPFSCVPCTSSCCSGSLEGTRLEDEWLERERIVEWTVRLQDISEMKALKLRLEDQLLQLETLALTQTEQLNGERKKVARLEYQLNRSNTPARPELRHSSTCSHQHHDASLDHADRNISGIHQSLLTVSSEARAALFRNVQACKTPTKIRGAGLPALPRCRGPSASIGLFATSVRRRFSELISAGCDPNEAARASFQMATNERTVHMAINARSDQMSVSTAKTNEQPLGSWLTGQQRACALKQQGAGLALDHGLTSACA